MKRETMNFAQFVIKKNLLIVDIITHGWSISRDMQINRPTEEKAAMYTKLKISIESAARSTIKRDIRHVKWFFH